MRRREFLIHSATAAGAALLSTKALLTARVAPPPLVEFTGTVGSGHHSHQTALGVKGLSDLLLHGYDHGLRFFDSADSYGSHPHVAEALKHVPRDKITV